MVFFSETFTEPIVAKGIWYHHSPGGTEICWTLLQLEFAVFNEDKTRGCDKCRKCYQGGAHSNAQLSSSNMVQELGEAGHFLHPTIVGYHQGTLSSVISATGNSGWVSCYSKIFVPIPVITNINMLLILEKNLLSVSRTLP